MNSKDKNAEEIAKNAAENTLALNPLVGMREQDLIAASTNVMRAMIAQPRVVEKEWLSFASTFGDIVTSRSDIKPEPKDRRFADSSWQDNSVSKALMQSYIAWSNTVVNTVEHLDLPDRDAARARLVTSLFVDAMAPSNNFFANPTAIKAFFETGGKSVVEGMKNLITDTVKNGGLPSSVDVSKFEIGKNVAATPGHVVFRNEVIELIHYTSNTDMVYKRPLLIVPPQINKYYSVDLSPGKSIIEFLLANGIQPYCISWRNPTAEQKDWDLQTYIEALDEAVDAMLEISGADSINLMGSCSGGITLSAYLGWLAAQKKSEKANAAILAVCVLDTQASTDNDLAALITPESVMASKQMTATQGVLDGQDMAKMFAWMRPNDLVWNYWVNNYLLGNQPPAFDVLFWNADTTRLPAGLHGDFLDMIFTNPFVNPGALSIGGHPINMKNVKHETYVIAGTTDHITPWEGVYKTARLFGPKTTFILSNSGHLQSLLNPPGKPKSWYMKAPAKMTDGGKWSETAVKHEGSWWLDWVGFLKERSGDEVKSPAKCGNTAYPPLCPAPGTYVFEE